MIVTAGPGTGKTKTLVARIAWLIGEQKVKPADIAAVTFTNKAADEMRQRLIQHFGGRRAIQGMRIGTFHSLCLDLLSRDGQEITIADENEAAVLATEILKEGKLQLSPRKFLQEVSQVKSGVIETPPHPEAYGNTACVTLTICCSMHSSWIRPSPISSWMNFKIAMKCNTASYKNGAAQGRACFSLATPINRFTASADRARGALIGF